MSGAATSIPYASAFTTPCDVEILLSDPQADVYECPAQFRVLIAGRRFGKTELAVTELITAATERDGVICWYVGPDYTQAKDIAWGRLKARLQAPEMGGWVRSINESELRIELVNGSVIAVKGASKPDSLRGRKLYFLVLDEFPLIDRRAWEEALAPSLADTPGSRVLFIGTPMGYNWAHKLYLEGLGWPNNGQSIASFQFTSVQGGFISPTFLALERRRKDPRLYRQEYEASFESLGGRVYSSFQRKMVPLGNMSFAIEDIGEELHIGIDFNINPMSCVVGQRAAGRPQVLRAIELHTSNTEELASYLRQLYPDRTLIAYPDPSGRYAKGTNAPAGRTDFTILESYGMRVQARRAAPLVKDRVNNTNANLWTPPGIDEVEAAGLLNDPHAYDEAFTRGMGERRCLIDIKETGPLTHGLDGLTYKEGTNVPNKQLGLDHMPDAFGYWLWEEFNLMDGLLDALPSAGPVHMPYAN